MSIQVDAAQSTAYVVLQAIEYLLYFPPLNYGQRSPSNPIKLIRHFPPIVFTFESIHYTKQFCSAKLHSYPRVMQILTKFCINQP